MNVQLQCPSSSTFRRDVRSTQERVVITTSSGSKEDYRHGFGSYDIGEFYLGNEKIFQLTSQNRYELRIDLAFKNAKYYALYSYFRILGENDKYRLKVSGYSGNASDSLISHHNDAIFSTFDRDTPRKCAQTFKGAWWYNKCHTSHLNGVWGSTVKGQGVNWSTLTYANSSVTFTEMKIREIYTLS
ncbi:hypothetical protein Btru_067843 [Bulinus truncatus]|nr:hypothetical protein Btru_067843 [Bulinus truncatus]